jgi:hypothetical protein
MIDGILSDTQQASGRPTQPFRRIWKSMGIPGAVKTMAAASVDRFRAYQPLGSFGLASYGTSALPFATSSCDSL